MYVMRKKDKSSYVLSLPPAPVILKLFVSLVIGCQFPPPKKPKRLHNILYFRQVERQIRYGVQRHV